MRHAVGALLLASLLLPGAGRADLYRVVAEDGSEAFTDSPTDGSAVLLSRDPAPPRQKRAPSAGGRSSKAKLPVAGTITSSYGVRHDPIDGRLRTHQGVDIAVSEGTEVRPVAPGRVAFSGYRGGYGNLVMVEHEHGAVSLYAHNLMNVVKVGQRVDGKDVIALTGSTGRSTGPHLHFELWKGTVNYTSAYLANQLPPDLLPAGGSDPIRQILLADGSLLFTNVQ